MKKISIIITVVLVLIISTQYIFIPDKVSLSETVKVFTNDKWTTKFLTEKDMRAKWWPEKSTADKEIFWYNGTAFSIDSLYYNQLIIGLSTEISTAKSRLVIIPQQVDTSVITWQFDYLISANPFTRWQHYRQALETNEDIKGILSHLATHLNNPQNIYGINIELGNVTDTLLLTNKAKYISYPATKEVYAQLSNLQNYINGHGATACGTYMLNIDSLTPNSYEAFVAIPIDKDLPQTNEFKIKRMFPGNALITLVTGGRHTLQNALGSLDQYKSDHGMQVPAIPYQSIITDRLKEPDSSKWITKIYFPVF